MKEVWWVGRKEERRWSGFDVKFERKVSRAKKSNTLIWCQKWLQMWSNIASSEDMEEIRDASTRRSKQSNSIADETIFDSRVEPSYNSWMQVGTKSIISFGETSLALKLFLSFDLGFYASHLAEKIMRHVWSFAIFEFFFVIIGLTEQKTFWFNWQRIMCKRLDGELLHCWACCLHESKTLIS